MPAGLSFLWTGGCTTFLERACKEDDLSNFFRVNGSPPCHVHSSSCMCETATISQWSWLSIWRSRSLNLSGQTFSMAIAFLKGYVKWSREPQLSKSIPLSTIYFFSTWSKFCYHNLFVDFTEARHFWRPANRSVPFLEMTLPYGVPAQWPGSWKMKK